MVTRGVQGPVESITHFNGSEVPVGNVSMGAFPAQDPELSIFGNEYAVAHLDFERDSDGNVSKIIAFDARIARLWTFDYRSTDRLKRSGQYLSPSGFDRSRTASRVSYATINFDEEGLLLSLIHI